MYTLEAAFIALDYGDYTKAIRILRFLALQENADAQFNLGAMYYHGDGVPQNHQEAAKWLHQAAETFAAQYRRHRSGCA